jgi:hypothetical protein
LHALAQRPPALLIYVLNSTAIGMSCSAAADNRGTEAV